MPLDDQARRQLVSFIGRNRVAVVQPARRHAAGWLWTGTLGEAVEIAGEHEPIRVLTVPADPPPHVVRLVACLAMRGEIDHVLQVAPGFTRMQPIDNTEDLRESLISQPELPAWWQCPYGDRMRCHCLHPRR